MNKIKGKTPNGDIKEYDVILTFNNNKNNTNYVVYTDNTYDKDNKLKIYAAKYDDTLDEPFIGYPTTEEEWQDIMEVVDSVLLKKD